MRPTPMAPYVADLDHHIRDAVGRRGLTVTKKKHRRFAPNGTVAPRSVAFRPALLRQP